MAYAGDRDYIDAINNIYYKDLSIGEAFNIAFTWRPEKPESIGKVYTMSFYGKSTVPRYTATLIGDPTLQINLPYRLKEPIRGVKSS